jgi:hypothetical protein
LGMEARASSMLSKHSYHLSHVPSPDYFLFLSNILLCN